MKINRMYSKQEAQNLKKEFWIAFGKSFPRKWLLYNTQIKDFSLKFYANQHCAEVSLDIAMKDELLRNAYFEKIVSLDQLLPDFIGDFYQDEFFEVENQKIIAKFWVTKSGVSIFNKNSWQEIFTFFVEKMDGFERFFLEYEDYIKDI